MPSSTRSLPFPAFRTSAPLVQCACHDPAYPHQIQTALSPHAADTLTILGCTARLFVPAITIVGSRQTPSRYLTAAASLARVLSDEVGPVVSGGAAGADSAALAGAVRGRSGAIVIPACGFARLPKGSLALAENGTATFLGLFPFYAPFNAGYAIQRNSVLAAMGRALVLVASDLKGGSTYAVNWALAHDVSVFCFESGATTPAANAHLIRTGRAKALSLRDKPADWADAISLKIMNARIETPRLTSRHQDWFSA